MRITIPDDDAQKLDKLKGPLSGSAWMRGAVNAADEDAEIAQLIYGAAPEMNHGGARPGAGRPRKPRKKEHHGSSQENE